MATSTNYLWTEPNDSDLVKNGASAIRTLGNAIDASLWSSGYGQAGKNMVINGNMNVSQRGTSFTSNASNVNIYTVDRFQARNSALGEYTITQETDSPAGLGSSAKWLCTTADASPAASDFLIYRQLFEGQALQKLQFATATAQTTTLSFWVKSNVTGTYIVNLTNSGRQISSSYTISSSGTWEKKSITFAGDTIGTIANTTAASVNLNFFLATGTDRSSGTLQTTWATTVNANTAVGQTNIGSAINNYWQITGVQWEMGTTATPFQTSTGTIQGELAACQRYYFRINAAGESTYPLFGNGSAFSTTVGSIPVILPVSMRTKPTIIDFPTVGTYFQLADPAGSTTALTALTTNSALSTLTSIWLEATVASGLTQNRPYFLRGANSTSAYLGISAEL